MARGASELHRARPDVPLGRLSRNRRRGPRRRGRDIICPDKVNTEQWLQVVRTAHEVGLRTTSTIMFGHLERPQHQARHLLNIRRLQLDTGGFTEFVPLPFVHMQSPVYVRGQARKGPTWREAASAAGRTLRQRTTLYKDVETFERA